MHKRQQKQEQKEEEKKKEEDKLAKYTPMQKTAYINIKVKKKKQSRQD